MRHPKSPKSSISYDQPSNRLAKRFPVSTNRESRSPKGLHGDLLWVPADTVTKEEHTNPITTMKWSQRQFNSVNRTSLRFPENPKIGTNMNQCHHLYAENWFILISHYNKVLRKGSLCWGIQPWKPMSKHDIVNIIKHKYEERKASTCTQVHVVLFERVSAGITITYVKRCRLHIGIAHAAWSPCFSAEQLYKSISLQWLAGGSWQF